MSRNFKSSIFTLNSPAKAKVWQVIGLIFIGTGLIVLGWGGWQFFQYQLELSKPPPVRIVDMSTIDQADLTVKSEIKPVSQVQIDSYQGSSDANLTPPTAIPSMTGNSRLVADTQDVQLGEDRKPDVKKIKINQETSISEAPSPAIPSLADNPLPVIESENTPQSTDRFSSPFTPAAGPPTRIVAESINLDADVIEVGWKQVVQNGVSTNVWEVADYAAGWHENSLLPGQGGNVVFSGHNNIKGEVFRYLVDLEVGDNIALYVQDQVYEYLVADKFILKDKGQPDSVRRANARWIGPINEERLTLVTCWPYTNNTHRLIVIARPVDNVVKGGTDF